MFLPFFLSSMALGIIIYGFIATMITSTMYAVLYALGGTMLNTTAGNILLTLHLVLIFLPVIIGVIRSRKVHLTKDKVPVKGIKKKIKLGFFSDLHLGLLVGKKRLSWITGIYDKWRPDLLIIGGDLYDTKPANIKGMESRLRKLARIAPAYTVMGNHEFINGVEACTEHILKMGMTPLRNKTIKDERTGLNLIGVDDTGGQSPIHDNSFDARSFIEANCGDKSGSPIIFINHSPLLFGKAAECGIELQLSGHTHGGQMWPFGYITRALFKDGDRGLNRKGSSYLLTSMGAGTWGPPIRTGSRSEIHLIELVPMKEG